jgi:hypothetical protein
MITPKQLYAKGRIIYRPELLTCIHCGDLLVTWNYLAWDKTVQTPPFFSCAPLELEEYNLDYRCNLTLCCQLSGYAGGTSGTDVIGNLRELSLAEAVARFHQRVAIYLADKRERVRRGAFGELDHFPCWYCVQYLDKVPRLHHFPTHPWAQGAPQAASRETV